MMTQYLEVPLQLDCGSGRVGISCRTALTAFGSNTVFCSAVGGGEDLRRYWLDYLRKTYVQVFVVDASDRARLLLAKAELHRLLKEEPQLPVVVLGNKQDKVDAVSGAELHEALALHSVAADRKLFLLTSQLDSGAVKKSYQDLDTIQNLLLQLL